MPQLRSKNAQKGRCEIDWISVKDKLPDKWDWYLTVQMFPDKGRYYRGIRRTEFSSFDKSWESNSTIVTHWMPLPELPEEADERKSPDKFKEVFGSVSPPVTCGECAFWGKDENQEHRPCSNPDSFYVDGVQLGEGWYCPLGKLREDA